MRKFLDNLYFAGGVLAALCMIGMLLVILGQMVTRWFLIAFPGSTDYAGYLMAASSFLAFPYALNAGAHIRVTLFIKALGNNRYWGELWCFAIGTAATTYVAWYAGRLVYFSYQFNDISQGQDASPLWIVQLPLIIGTVLLAICFWDNLLSLLFSRKDNVKAQSIEEHG